MGLGANHQTITSHDVFIPELWSKKVQAARESRLHARQFFLESEDEITSVGDTLHTETISNLDTNDKAASTQVTLQTPTESDVDLVINKHKEVSFLIEDNLSIKAQIRLVREYTRKGGYALGKKFDSDLLSLVTSLTTTDLGTAGAAMTDAVVVAAWQTLSDADVPEDERAWFFRPNVLADLWKLSDFKLIDLTLATSMFKDIDLAGALKRKYVGVLYGAPVFLTTNIPSATTGSPATTYYRNLYAHKEAFQFGIQKEVRTQMAYILEYLGNLTVLDMIYGVALYRGDHGVELDR